MRFHLTITDNKTGAVLRDCDTNAIIAGMTLDHGEALTVGLTDCRTSELVAATASALTAVDAVLENEPKTLRRRVARSHRKFKKDSKIK